MSWGRSFSAPRLGVGGRWNGSGSRSPCTEARSGFSASGCASYNAGAASRCERSHADCRPRQDQWAQLRSAIVQGFFYRLFARLLWLARAGPHDGSHPLRGGTRCAQWMGAGLSRIRATLRLERSSYGDQRQRALWSGDSIPRGYAVYSMPRLLGEAEDRQCAVGRGDSTA